MTREEAIQAMYSGKTVTNSYLQHCSDKCLRMVEGEFVNNDGYFLEKKAVETFIAAYSNSWWIVE